ncbi:MAG: methionine synthase, partial [Candidatus Omnitrophota bacterium]
YEDPAKAVDLVLKYLPQIPFWPQLPKLGGCEGMVAQFAQNLPCLKISLDGVNFEPKYQERELENFYGQIISNNVDYFKIGPDIAAGLYEFYHRLEKFDLKDIEFIKCHVTGAFTFAASIKDKGGRALLHDPIFMQVIVKGLIMKALWQIKLFTKFAKKIIIFLDEPYLAGFGSAYTPINREDIVNGLTELTTAIKSENVYVGVHCCGNTDWSIFTGIKTIDIINFDAFNFLEKFTLYADSLKGFLKRGGIICWGIVPTQEFSGRETAESLKKKIDHGIDILLKKGLDKDLLLNNLLISPACGLGTLESAKAENILKMLSEISYLIRK